MKNRILSIVLVFAMLFGLASCSIQKLEDGAFGSGSDGADANGESTTAAELPEEMVSVFDSLNIDINDPESLEDQLIEEDTEDVEFEFGDDLIDDSSSSTVEVELNDSGRPDRSDMDSNLVEILEQDKFTLAMNIRTESSEEVMEIPLTIMKNGEELYMEIKIPVQEKGGSMKVNLLTSKDKNLYMIIPSLRMYMSVPAETLGDLGITDIIEDETINSKYIETREIEIDGKKYTCDVYEDGDVTSKHYYDENGIKRVEYTDGENVSIMEITSVSSEVDSAKFKLPAGYIDMAKIMGEGYTGLDGLL